MQCLVASNYTPQTNKYYLHQQHDLLYTILGPAFGTLVFLDMTTILWSLHPMDVDTAFKQISAALVKIWSLHVVDFILWWLICIIKWGETNLSHKSELYLNWIFISESFAVAMICWERDKSTKVFYSQDTPLSTYMMNNRYIEWVTRLRSVWKIPIIHSRQYLLCQQFSLYRPVSGPPTPNWNHLSLVWYRTETLTHARECSLGFYHPKDIVNLLSVLSPRGPSSVEHTHTQ